MNFLKKLLEGSPKSKVEELTNDYCPNCWGDQEYGDVVREKFQDPQIDINNHEAKYAFVQKFMVTHLKGIKLQNTLEGKECPRCKAKQIS